MKTRYEDIVDIESIGMVNTKKMNELLKLANQEDIPFSNKDVEKILLLAIDFQNDFMEEGELGVPNSHKDVENTTKFIYKNLHKITDIMISLDTHQPQQIFHPCWWIDENGNPPEPFTIITAKDIESGKWQARYNKEESLEYVLQLDSIGKKQLCIWPYHCLEGTSGAALENQFANMVYFHSVARDSKTIRVVKGTEPLSEMYGIIRPEYSKEKYLNSRILDQMQLYDKILVVGEAKSHCVLESIRQIVEYYGRDGGINSKIYVLEDCMSPIPHFEEVTNKDFLELNREYGINIVEAKDFVL
ncbi:TPA: hypothetical protein QCU08_004693 [Bacillus anthracis]|nr:hypothetical protein [Bacillus cereus biovar anthracis]